MVTKKDRVIRRNKKERRKKVQRWSLLQWFFVSCVVVFISVIIYVFIFSPLVHITVIDIRGTTRVHTDDISDKVNQNLDGKKLQYIAKRNYFFVSGEEIIASIKEDQRIKNVSITKQFPNKIEIEIIEYDTVPIWCIGSVDGTCFELDTNGCAVRKVDMHSPLVYDNQHFIIVDHGHDSIEARQCVVSEEKLSKINFLGQELIYALNVGIKQPYTIDFRGSGEIKFDTDEGWYIFVDLSHDAKEVLHIANLFAKKIELPSSRSDLEYVDLRFPEKMFYKMKDGVEQEEQNDEENVDSEMNEKKDDN